MKWNCATTCLPRPHTPALRYVLNLCLPTALVVLFVTVADTQAQTIGRVQPTVLRPLPASVFQPAVIRTAASDLVPLPNRVTTYRLPVESTRMAGAAGSLPGSGWTSTGTCLCTGTPTLTARPGIPAGTITNLGYSNGSVISPAYATMPVASYRTLRPVGAPAVPSGYTLGRGLIGQPKLYRPGQPVRNFLRYITP